MIRNILFDWSGTLSDDLRLVHQANNAVFIRLGIQAISFQEFREKFVLPYADFYRRYTNAPVGKIESMYGEEILRLPPAPLFAGALNALSKLVQHGARMAVLSSSTEAKLNSELERHYLRKYFITTKGSVRDKRTIIASILSENHFSPSETAFVGDMMHDIDAGHAAGVTTIGVTWGYQSREKLSTAHPDFIVDSFEELRSLILSPADKKGI